MRCEDVEQYRGNKRKGVAQLCTDQTILELPHISHWLVTPGKLIVTVFRQYSTVMVIVDHSFCSIPFN